LLKEIDNGNKKLGILASILSSSPQEVSRHLMRLREQNIIDKDSENCFSITEFGKTAMIIMPLLKFILSNKNFILHHRISSLPFEFIERIGELEGCQNKENAGTVFRHIQKVVGSSQEYVWAIADHQVVNLAELIASKAIRKDDNNVNWRIILPPATCKSIDFRQLMKSFENILRNKIELRMMEDKEIKIALILNEQMAGVSFTTTMEQQIDFNTGFKGNNPKFHKWCHDLFLFYWTKSKGNSISC